jgi:hypothetical protein
MRNGRHGWIIKSGFVFLLSWLLISQAISYALNATGLEEYSVWAKTKEVIADRRANLVFIGSSHVHYAANPVVFDEEMSKKGYSFRSYNLANDGQSVVETQYILEKLFASSACCIKFVIVEVDFATFGPMGPPQTIRARTFFNVLNAIRYWRYYHGAVFHPQAPGIDPAEYNRKILTATALHYSNAGIFKFWFDHIRSRLAGQENRPDPALRGYASTTEMLAARFTSDAQRDEYQASLDYMSKLAVTPEEIAATNVITNYQFDLVISLASFVRSKGAELILLRTPMTGYFGVEAIFLAKHQAWCNQVPLLLDFGIPSEHPALFDPRNRFDADHLNQDGAAIFTRGLADRFASLLDADALPLGQPVCRGLDR